MHSRRRTVPQPEGRTRGKEGTRRFFPRRINSVCQVFGGAKVIWERYQENFKSSVAQGAWSRRQMQFHGVLQDNVEDTGPSVFDSAPVEHGAEEDKELKRQDY